MRLYRVATAVAEGVTYDLLSLVPNHCRCDHCSKHECVDITDITPVDAYSRESKHGQRVPCTTGLEKMRMFELYLYSIPPVYRDYTFHFNPRYTRSLFMVRRADLCSFYLSNDGKFHYKCNTVACTNVVTCPVIPNIGNLVRWSRILFEGSTDILHMAVNDFDGVLGSTSFCGALVFFDHATTNWMDRVKLDRAYKYPRVKRFKRAHHTAGCCLKIRHTKRELAVLTLERMCRGQIPPALVRIIVQLSPLSEVLRLATIETDRRSTKSFLGTPCVARLMGMACVDCPTRDHIDR